jgi:hypothetical protein
MPNAKDIMVKPISGADARRVVQAVHYSGKTVNNSQLHMGVFLNGRLEGAMQFGPSLDKRKMQGLVENTPWNGFLELNRMAFSEALPRNSESRALAVAFRLIRKHYPHVQWVVSFADGAQCGDGTIYRASGFVLTSVKENSTLIQLADGSIGANVTYSKGSHILKTGGAKMPAGAKKLSGFQLRYMYFLDPTARERLTVPILPFSKIDEMGAGMYRGKSRPKQATLGVQPDSGGATPTRTLQDTAEEAEHAC